MLFACKDAWQKVLALCSEVAFEVLSVPCTTALASCVVGQAHFAPRLIYSTKRIDD